jgi:hypothetical protein
MGSPEQGMFAAISMAIFASYAAAREAVPASINATNAAIVDPLLILRPLFVLLSLGFDRDSPCALVLITL